MERSDDDLMLLVRGGVERAFDILLRRHQRRVLRIAGRYLGDASLATDVAQCVFLELYRSRERYQPRGKFVGYLCRITLNQCHMLGRAARASRRHAPLDTVSELAADAVLAREKSRDLELALGQLSEKLRAVVVLRYGGDVELAEIADTLDIPLGTVKRRLFDAMAKLRTIMAGES